MSGSFQSNTEAIAAEFASRNRLPGMSVTVASGGQAWTAVHGHADRKTAVSATTSFRIGSVSKALTSAALGLLIDEGTIELDRPVQEYVPSFPEKPEGEITIRYLAAHQSGLPHYRGRDMVNRRSYSSLTEALDKFKHRPLLFTPGHAFAYSSFGWNLLGAALEAAAGMPFLDLMHRRVFEPLGLDSTLAEVTRHPNQARPYATIAGLELPAPRVDGSDSWPSAGFVSTTGDLVGFGRAMRSGSFVSSETVELLWGETTTASGTRTGYGLGWQWIELAGHRAVGHGGSHVGATAELWMIPEHDLTVAVATNTNAPRGSLKALAAAMAGEVIDGRPESGWFRPQPP